MWSELLVRPPWYSYFSSDRVPNTNMATERTVFLIGATGFVGGYVLELLGQKHPEFRVLCLLRNATKARADTLRSLNRNAEIVQGTLDDQAAISTAAEKADVVILVARSDHLPSVQAVLDGLTTRAKENPDKEPPTFLHMSSRGTILREKFCGALRAIR